MSDPRAILPCNRVVELVSDYLEGDLPIEDRVQLEQHLVLCDPCVHYIEQVRSTVVALKRLPHEGLAPASRALLIDAFRKRKRGDKP